MKKSNSKVLGKGLDALISSHKTIQPNKNQVLTINISQIAPNNEQPRKDFENLEELSDSIKSHGIIQPLIVLNTGANYQIIAGERRWRAAKLAGLKEIPVIVKESLTAKDKMEIALIENIQRKDLNAIEEAMAYKELVEKFQLSIDGVSRTIGKDRTTITNTIRLLTLPIRVQDYIRKGVLQQGHVRPLIGIEDEKLILQIVDKIIKDKLSVREIEHLINKNKDIKKRKGIPKVKKEDVNLKNAKEQIQQKLATKVKIVGNLNKGKILIEYYSQEDLDRLVEILIK